MTDGLPGPSLGALRAAGANLMAARLYPDALKAIVEREEFFARAHTLGVDKAAAERILGPIVEDRLGKGLPRYGPEVYRLAMEKVYSEVDDA